MKVCEHETLNHSVLFNGIRFNKSFQFYFVLHELSLDSHFLYALGQYTFEKIIQIGTTV